LMRAARMLLSGGSKTACAHAYTLGAKRTKSLAPLDHVLRGTSVAPVATTHETQ
jgi:hypothetical protein